MADVPKPTDPVKDTVLSQKRRLINTIFFVIIGYLVFYVIFDRLLFRPTIGAASMNVLDWIFGVVWTLIGAITLLSIYLPELAAKHKSVLENIGQPIQTTVQTPEPAVQPPVAQEPTLFTAPAKAPAKKTVKAKRKAKPVKKAPAKKTTKKPTKAAAKKKR